MIVLSLSITNFQTANAIKILNYSLMKNETVKLTVDTRKTITWVSNNKKVATVDKKGNVKAKSLGEATITAKVGKKTYNYNVNVSKPAYAIMINNGSYANKPTTSDSIDTPDTNTYITKETYEKLKTDITYDEAVDIIGLEGTPSTTNENDQGTATYTWPGENGSSATVIFKDGKLFSKTLE